MMIIPEKELFDNPNSEPSRYLSTGRTGYFSLLAPVVGGDHLAQESFEVTRLPWVLSNVDPRRDAWISQAVFRKKNRRIINLDHVGLLFVDLDPYHLKGFKKLPEAEILHAVAFLLAEKGFPFPSLVVYSGRGYHLKWILKSPVPAQALPRWNAMQALLCDILSPLGSDPQAKDGSRVLRLEKTTNSRSGETVKIVYDDPEAVFDFEFLAESLPYLRPVKTQKQQAAERRQPASSLAFNRSSLNWARLNDLRRLRRLRGERVGVGHRNLHLLWEINFLLQSDITRTAEIWKEAQALKKEIDPGWGEDERNKLCSVYKRAREMQEGKTVEWMGVRYEPLYTPHNETLINLFRITSEEQTHMQTIIDTAEKYRRNNERRRPLRAETSREEYLKNSLTNQKPWEALGVSRAWWYRIGKPNPV